MLKQERCIQRAIWLIVLLVLILAFLHAWLRVEREASQTAMALASNNIYERSNYYKQQWLLAGQPTRLEIDQKFINYSARGWVTPFNQRSQVDCQYWFELLYPEQRVLEAMPLRIQNKSIADDFECHVFYPHNQRLDIQLVDDQFKVSVGFTAE